MTSSILPDVHGLLTAVEAHAEWAGPIVFLVSMAESLALVGLFVPGATFMVGAGFLIGGGALPAWPTIAWAIAGAIAGDAVSYELGRRYSDRIDGGSRFQRWRPAIERSKTFFHRYGAWSILIGRFVGALRPIIPLVAGTLALPRHRFYAANIASALGWGPAYIGPGIFVGESLDVSKVLTEWPVLFAAAALAVLWVAILLARIFTGKARR